MADYRDIRIGVANAARLLGIRVTVLKEAVRHEQELAPGVQAPRPIGYLGTQAKEMYFKTGEIMDAAEAMKAAGRTSE